MTQEVTIDMDDAVTIDGRSVAYLARGPADGRPVFHLHGMPSYRHEQGLFPDDALDRHHVRLISVDRPGWGDTDPIPGGDRIARSADVLAVADVLGVASMSLLAVSSGGSYALALAAVAPERIERVVLASAQMPYDDDASLADLQPEQQSLVPVARLGRVDALVAGCQEYRERLITGPLDTMAQNMSTLSPSERAFVDDPRVNAIVVDCFAAAARASVDGIVDDLITWPAPFEVDLSSIRCPVRAVHGTADDWEPLSNLRRSLAQIADARLVLMDGFNHFGPLLAPDLTLSLLRS